MSPRIDPHEALPDEITGSTDAIPLPAYYVGTLYTGNGGKDAQAALDDVLSGITAQPGDEPVPSTSEMDAAPNDSAAAAAAG
jgi:hypothetical protein